MSSLRAGEEGFTLIELLLVVAISAVIVFPMGAALMGILHNSDATTRRMTQSHDAQMATAFFPNDVQSSDVSPTVTSSDARCDKGGNTPVIRFEWTDYTAGGSLGVYNLVVYSTEPGAVGVAPLLRRRFCQGATYGGLNATPLNDMVVVRYLSSSITPSVCGTAGGLTACGTAQPAGSVVLSIVEQPVTQQTTYAFQVSGVRRAL
jgi:prepilin-type N-terminal cleavage/methylation domain-containing protein